MSATIEIAFTLSRRDLHAFAAHQARRTPELDRARRVHHFLWPAVFLLVGHFLSKRSGNPLAVVPFAAGAGLWVLLFPLYLRRVYRRHVLRSLRAGGMMPGDYRLRADAEGTAVVSGSGERTIPWSAVARLATTDSHAFIHLDEGSALIVPRASVNEGDYEAFVEALSSRAPSTAS